jgi:tetratricopeptide (TPR) repeat protein
MVKVLLLFVGIVFTFSVRANPDDPPSLNEEQWLEFDYIFTEGIRYKLLEDYKGALAHFEKCMQMYPGSAAVRYEIASILMTGGNFDLSLQFIREAVKLDADNVWYRLLLANVLRGKSMIEESCNVYDELVVRYPEREDFYLIQTELYISVEKWTKAIEVLDKYERQFGISEEVSLEKTKLYARQGDINRASKELMKLIKKFPAVNEYRGLLAELYLDNDQEKKGLSLLKKLLKKNPFDGFLQFYLTDYYLEKGDTLQSNSYLYDALVNDSNESAFKVQYLLKMLVNVEKFKIPASSVYKNVLLLLERYPDDLSVRMLHADFLKQNGRLEECRTELEFVLSRDQRNFLVWEELLLLYNHSGDTASMLSKGKECIRFFPDESLPYVMVGLPLLMQKRYEESIYYFNKGKDLSLDDAPMKGQLYAYLGDAYHGLDSLELTFKMFDEALKINPNDILVLNNYSYYLTLSNQRLDEAERMSSKTLAIEPNNPTFLDTYAWVLFKKGDYSLAKFYMRSAMEKDKEPSSVLYDHYGDILFMNGEKDEAVNMWMKALELSGGASDELKYKIEHGLYLEDKE